jgi:hypothetical protein
MRRDADLYLPGNFAGIRANERTLTMSITLFRLENFYEQDEDLYVFYPSRYSRGYPFSDEDRARMNSVLEPFLNRRMRQELLALSGLATFSLLGGLTTYLVKSTTEELDGFLATSPGLWLFYAAVLAGVIVLPVVLHLQWKIRRLLYEMDIYPSEPPRPDFLIVEGEFSPTRLAVVIFGLGTILVLAGILFG